MAGQLGAARQFGSALPVTVGVADGNGDAGAVARAIAGPAMAAIALPVGHVLPVTDRPGRGCSAIR
jgi:hypothetical protein